MGRALSRNVLAAILCAAVLGACAEERAPIDRTQPNALAKSLFQGEWYYQQTVVDIPGTWSPTFVGETNWWGMERVRFDIQERWLYVRRSYERIKDAEGGVTYTAEGPVGPDGRPYMGAVIAAYPIVSHFDIRRAYNPTTGEEYNVLEENMVDRPWYEREYIRVDWSTNYATNFNFLVDDLHADPVAYYVQWSDANGDGVADDPDYPLIEMGAFDAAGNMLAQPYIDVTNMYMLRPGMTYIPELGESYPTCWFFDRAAADCTTEPVKIRSSFLRVDPNRQYVPRPFKGEVTDFFGLFTQDRLVYDKDYELRETKRERYAQLHNLWREWYDASGNVISPAARQVRPMIYYVHDWPASQENVLRKVEEEWNAIFRRAVNATGNGYSGPVLKFCTSPVREDEDHDLCGPTGFAPRLGDIRYNWIAYVPKFYDGFALLGLGPSNTDPLTGEVISAGAYLYVYNDIVAESTAEIVQLLNGDISPTDYISGVDLTSWQQKAANARRAETIVTDEDLEGMVAGQNLQWTARLGYEPSPDLLASLDGKYGSEVIPQLAKFMYDRGMFNGTMDDSDGRLRSLAGSYIEDMLLTPEMKMAAGIMPGSSQGAFTQEFLNNASVARLGPFRVMEALDNRRRYWVNVKNVDLADMADDGYVGLAEQWKGKSREEIRAGVKQDIFHAVLAHELGHSFNLHHNFGGSEDVVNYDPKYWEIRMSDGSVGPRWLDPITENELKSNIYRYAYSSVMDYSRLTLDHGPGRYDAAAILIGYANKVEVFQDISGMDLGMFNEWSTSDGQIIQFYSDRPRSFHYTEWFKRMGTRFYEDSNRVLVDADEVDWKNGWDANFRPRVPYIFCSPYQSDIGNGCFTRDYGADEYERVRHHIQLANTYYITRAFPRYAVGASMEEYLGRTYGRTYRRLKGYNDYYALLTGIMAPIYTPAQMNAFLTDPYTGWAAYTIAEHEIINFILQTIAMPDVTGFELQTDPAGQQYYATSPFLNAPVKTDVSNARYFTTTWWDPVNGGDICGMYWWECLHHFGFYLDKMMALHALTDAQTYFVARDTAEDIREWRINFFDNYSTVVNRFLGGILAQDWQAFAPRWTGSDVVHPDYGDPTKPLPAGTPIDAATGFTVQLYAAVLGMARLQNNFDKSFLDSTRMWLDGTAFGVTSTHGIVEYVDPNSGKRYRAIDLPEGVAARMITRANTVKSRSNSCTSGCATGLSAAQKAAADGELVRYAQVLDLMVDLTGYYETFTQNYGDPYNPGNLP